MGKPNTCRTCRHYAVAPDSAGRRVARKHSVHACEAPIPDLSKILPMAVTTHYSWRVPMPRWMSPEEGKGCPLWASLSPKDTGGEE